LEIIFIFNDTEIFYKALLILKIGDKRRHQKKQEIRKRPVAQISIKGESFA